MNEQVVDGEVVEYGAEVIPAPGAPVSLFRTDDPAEVLARAKRTADALAPVVREAGMVVNVQGKDYLLVEAWQTLGQQVGVTGVIVSTRKLSDPDGWEARCEARTLDGRTIGAADSMCLRTEDRWKDGEEFELRSMAQTRSMSRALASVLRFIPTLAGMGGTPAEEMTNVSRATTNSGPRKPSQKQRDLFERLAKEQGFMNTDLSQLMAWADANLTGGRDGSMSKAIDSLMNKDQVAKTAAADELGNTAKAWAAEQSEVPGDVEGFEEQPTEAEDLPF